MRPFFFGRSERPLFGIHHPALTRGTPAGAALLCNPFGQEAIRAHRIYRVMAGKLARAGWHVLRFDYFGTGDSAGASDEGDQAQWIEDVLDASEELASSTGTSRVAWVGLRYGASLAALAAERAPRELSDLVLWDPVVDGRAYLTELADAHAAYMREDLIRWEPPTATPTEVLGFPLSEALRASIASLDLSRRKVRARRLSIVASKPPGQVPALNRFRAGLAGWALATRWLTVESASPSNSEEAMNASLVPNELVDAVVGCLQEPVAR